MKQNGEIVIGTLLIMCLIIFPLSWGFNKMMKLVEPQEKVIPVCKTDNGKIIYIMPEKKEWVPSSSVKSASTQTDQ